MKNLVAFIIFNKRRQKLVINWTFDHKMNGVKRYIHHLRSTPGHEKKETINAFQ